MWIYLARLGILISGDLRPIDPCPPPSLRWRAVIAILQPGLQGPDIGAFVFLTLLH